MMQFIYNPNAGDPKLIIQGEQFIHLYKSRRTKQSKDLFLRNLQDDILYRYKQDEINRKSATIILCDQTLSPNRPSTPSHIILSVIDSKSLQKALPTLNELSVGKLTLFYADYSQQNEKIDFEKLQKILINSSQQCGRSNTLEIELLQNLNRVLEKYPSIGVFDFGGTTLTHNPNLPVLIGPEGGLSLREKEKLAPYQTYSTKDKIILRSESACIYIASLLQTLPI